MKKMKSRMKGASIGEVKRYDISEEARQSLVKVLEHAMETKNDELFNKTYSNHLGCNQLADAIAEAHMNLRIKEEGGK